MSDFKEFDGIIAKLPFNQQIVCAVIVGLPFMVMYRATELWLSDVYLFEWMQRHHYMYIGFVLCLLSSYLPRFAIVAAYGDVVCIAAGEVLGQMIMEHSRALATAEEIKRNYCMYDHNGFVIWLQLFFTVIVLYVAYARQIEPRIKARRERRGK